MHSSGKSTILMAIEFALFRLQARRKADPVKAGAKKGLVTLCFEVDGKEYEPAAAWSEKPRASNNLTAASKPRARFCSYQLLK